MIRIFLRYNELSYKILELKLDQNDNETNFVLFTNSKTGSQDEPVVVSTGRKDKGR